jgi:hypothetical protein
MADHHLIDDRLLNTTAPRRRREALRRGHRLFAQVERVLGINRLRTITAEVVETARESIGIGP